MTTTDDLSVMPRSIVFQRRPPLSMLTVVQLLELAAEFKAMAVTASSPEVRRALNALTVRYVVMAAQREAEEGQAVCH